jgi:hypothetical protein
MEGPPVPALAAAPQEPRDERRIQFFRLYYVGLAAIVLTALVFALGSFSPWLARNRVFRTTVVALPFSTFFLLYGDYATLHGGQGHRAPFTLMLAVCMFGMFYTGLILLVSKEAVLDVFKPLWDDPLLHKDEIADLEQRFTCSGWVDANANTTVMHSPHANATMPVSRATCRDRIGSYYWWTGILGGGALMGLGSSLFQEELPYLADLIAMALSGFLGPGH